jgi:enoyl-[acyl-carrier-protein] reductase (NADH)
MNGSVAPPQPASSSILSGHKALIVGVANERSIAWGCAQAMRQAGADIAMTYLNDRAKPHVEPLAKEVGAALFLPLEVRDTAQLDAVFDAVTRRWGRLDILVHSIAFAPRSVLEGRVTDCPRDGFLTTMEVSCWSLIDLTRRAESLMRGGGTVFAMSYHGAERVIDRYGIMGGEGSARSDGSLHRRRTWSQWDPRPCLEPRSTRHPCRFGDPGFRHADGARGRACAGPALGDD